MRIKILLKCSGKSKIAVREFGNGLFLVREFGKMKKIVREFGNRPPLRGASFIDQLRQKTVNMLLLIQHEVVVFPRLNSDFLELRRIVHHLLQPFQVVGTVHDNDRVPFVRFMNNDVIIG